MRKELKKLRVEYGFTQKDVADRIGIALPSYSYIERGIRFGSHKTWEKIKTLYNLTDEQMWSIQKDS